MQIQGHVSKGVVVLEGGCVLPEGTPVAIYCGSASATPINQSKKRVEFPLIRSQKPGSVFLTAERVADLLESDDFSR